MAIDNPQVMIHQLRVKCERLEYALKALMRSVKEGTAKVTGYEYALAVGCLGGDFLTKHLPASRHMDAVLNDMLEHKFIKAERAEKIRETGKKKTEKEVVSTSEFVVYYSTDRKEYALGRKERDEHGLLEKIREAHSLTGSPPKAIRMSGGINLVRGEDAYEKVKDGVYKITYKQDKNNKQEKQ